jgi:hypothetical protein
MMQLRLPQRISAAIRDEVQSVLSELVADPEFSYAIEEVTLYSLQPTYAADPVRILVIGMQTNNRALLLGQFVYFSPPAMRGFHVEYLTARLETLFRSKCFPGVGELFIHLDVSQVPNSKQSPYTLLPLRKAISAGILTDDSRLAQHMHRYRLSHVLLAGSEISGPSSAMIEIVEEVCRTKRIKTCLDLFSGTGALSRVAATNGASLIVAVDLLPLDFDQALDEPASSVKRVTADAWLYEPEQSFDLLLADPFYDDAVRVAWEILPRMRGYARHLIFHIGLCFDRYWTDQVRLGIEKLCTRVAYRTIGESTVAIADLPSDG